MADRLAGIRAALEAHGQTHLLRFVEEITPVQRDALLEQIEAIDLDALGALKSEAGDDGPGDIAPAPYYPAAPDDPTRPYDQAAHRATGEAIIRAGRVAAFTVAGGQGTRLGWRGPKGTYPATVVTGKPLFRCFAEHLVAAEKKYGVIIPWYIMTSPENDAATRAFFLDNNCFGLLRKNIFLFPQGEMPALDAATGRILLATKHALAMSPDGHGGSIKALAGSGAIMDMRARGIEHVSYFQVDNPLARPIDPLFVGLHAAAPDSSAEMSSKMVVKAGPDERVGVFCTAGGKLRVIEYSDLPADRAGERDETGRLRFRAGSIAIHMIAVDFIDRLTSDAGGFALPWHRAVKRVPHLDQETGRVVEPEQPNATKLETFVFDALPLARSSIVLETQRLEEFAPIKNLRGTDSPATSHQAQSDRAGAWLEAHGVVVPRAEDGHVAARIEISPLTALEPADLVGVDLPESVSPQAELVL